MNTHLIYDDDGANHAPNTSRLTLLSPIVGEWQGASSSIPLHPDLPGRQRCSRFLHPVAVLPGDPRTTRQSSFSIRLPKEGLYRIHPFQHRVSSNCPFRQGLRMEMHWRERHCRNGWAPLQDRVVCICERVFMHVFMAGTCIRNETIHNINNRGCSGTRQHLRFQNCSAYGSLRAHGRICRSEHRINTGLVYFETDFSRGLRWYGDELTLTVGYETSATKVSQGPTALRNNVYYRCSQQTCLSWP
jgi:hypothetical protein